MEYKEYFEGVLKEMEDQVALTLSNLEDGYGVRKPYIESETGIPMDILTVILKRMKIDGKIELIMIFDESTGLPNGSGYALTN